jgi:effector-binding domain-containing protein
MNPNDYGYDHRLGTLGSDPWHPVYEQVIGQFSTGEQYTGGHQPSNRRNPKRNARRNGKRRSNPNAAKAMRAYHSGEYDSLADAWDAIRNGEL